MIKMLLRNGEIFPVSQYSAENPNVVFSGEFPPLDLLAAAGFELVDGPDPVPESVTARQARIVLSMLPAFDDAYPHLLAEVDAYFDSLPEPHRTIATITWERSRDIFRINPLIGQMQEVFPRLTNEVVDALYVCAASIPESGILPTLPLPVIPE